MESIEIYRLWHRHYVAYILVSFRFILGIAKIIVAYYAASQVFMTPTAKSTLYDGMLKGLIDSLGEPHSVYLDAEEYKSMKMQTSATYAGVGMVLGTDDKGLHAVSVMEDQPSF